jgi:hypothetical protein
MFFDKLCGVIEKPDELRGPTRGQRLAAPLISALHDLRRVVAEASVFTIPIIPHEVAFRQEVLKDNRALLGERFCLPFPTIAVEDKASCVLLQDLEAGAKGLAARRLFMDAFPTRLGRQAFTPSGFSQVTAPLPVDALCVAWGTVGEMAYEDEDRPRVRVRYDCGGVMIASKKQVFAWALGDAVKEDLKHTLENVRIAIEEIAYCNMPSRWVVETRGPESGEEAKGGRLRRAHQRPLFTTLTPGEIRTLFGRETEGTRKSPVVHQRRGHWRLLQSDRFARSGRKGEHLWIEATWVGETEAMVGSKRYIVRTDL